MAEYNTEIEKRSDYLRIKSMEPLGGETYDTRTGHPLVPAFPNAPQPKTLVEALGLLETTRLLLADALRKTSSEDIRLLFSTRALMQRLAVKHAATVIRELRFAGKFVPATWTAAHPPDDHTAAALADALGDVGFTSYSEAFRAAWNEIESRDA